MLLILKKKKKKPYLITIAVEVFCSKGFLKKSTGFRIFKALFVLTVLVLVESQTHRVV